ncbi:MAG: glycosyltransferase [Bacteroidia bacterium]|nr:MAG: glycosyltransferase [Bacteroidia bacterium]
MKILINCSMLKKGGVLQVGHSLVSELLHQKDHDYYFILSSLLRKDFPEMEEGPRFITYNVTPSVFLSLTGREKKLDALVERIQPDVVFSVFGPTYWKPKCPHVSGYAKAAYFYPDSPFIQGMPVRRKIRLFILKTLHMHDFKRFNQALVVETNDAAKRLESLIPSKKVFVVSNTYNQVFDQPELWDNTLKLPEFEGITLLSITANYRHKNLAVIPGVISYLKEHYPSLKFRFVLTLNRNEFRSVDEEQARHILFLGRASIHQVPSLYKQSDLMFMPTLLECFSATYPESMRMSVPVLTSDMPFARDVCGDAALYFDPLSIESIGEAIYTLASSEDLRSDMAERGQHRLATFETSLTRAQKYIDILETSYEANHSKF